MEGVWPLAASLRRRFPDLGVRVFPRGPGGPRTGEGPPEVGSAISSGIELVSSARRGEAGEAGSARPDLVISLAEPAPVAGEREDRVPPRIAVDPDPFGDDSSALAAGFLASRRSSCSLTVKIDERHTGASPVGRSAEVPIGGAESPRALALKMRATARRLVERAVAERLGAGVDADEVEAARSGIAAHRAPGFPVRSGAAGRLARRLTAGLFIASGYVQLRNLLRRRRGAVPGVIVNFHRVADHATEHWMTATTEAFARHIEFLARRYRIVSLGDLRERLSAPLNREPLVAVTFDDGYADCLDCAVPVLEERRAPAAFYVCTSFLDADGDLAHDARRGFGGLAKMNERDVAELALRGFEVGSHTRSHLDFRGASPREIDEEIQASRERLERISGVRCHGLSVPFGSPAHCRPEVFASARAHGYRYVLSHFDGQNFPGDDTFHLLRVRPSLEGLLSLRAAAEGWRGVTGLWRRVPRSVVVTVPSGEAMS